MKLSTLLTAGMALTFTIIIGLATVLLLDGSTQSTEHTDPDNSGPMGGNQN